MIFKSKEHHKGLQYRRNYEISIFWNKHLLAIQGGKAYYYGYPTQTTTNNGLIHIGKWNGDTNGIIVDVKDIEVK